ncbi:MAG: hypothetical protein IT376_11040 [Polyangiaceae bacterium]|nr:hypothetical protein [Polyangiaceae bacterium]
MPEDRSPAPGARRLWARARPLAPYAAAVAAAGVLARLVLGSVLAKTGGEPAAPLDDAYIHFQYARAFARLEPFEFTEGSAPVGGATSLLWPAVLAIAWVAGLREDRIVWAAWTFGFLAHGLLALETHRLARGLVSRDAALGAAAMVLLFGGYVWFAASGMETLPLAWLLVLGARLAADHHERPLGPRGRACMVVVAWAAPLVRPEGALATSLVVVALAATRGAPRARLAWAVGAAAGAGTTPLFTWLGTGSIASTTARVKWLPFNPYYDAAAFEAAVRANCALLFDTLLDGRVWSAVFLPAGAAPAFIGALAALVFAAARGRRRFRAAMALAVACGMFLPTTYDSFLWNRLRYLWPFFAGWAVGLAALADAIGDLTAHFDRRLVRVRGLLAGLFAGAFASYLPFSVRDVAESADAIRRQQVALGKWAKASLPADARIGVNDTGAVAYFSDRRTFDVVGLTTAGEAPYWLAGAGARFERYERLGRDRLPTHFIVYPHWLALDDVLGEWLTARSVPGATILGGETMSAHVADWTVLGSGALPHAPPPAPLLDEVDVADLESEREHHYVLLPAAQADCVAIGDGAGRVDGARRNRASEVFRLRLTPGGVFVARVASDQPRELELIVAGRPLGVLQVTGETWDEPGLDLPADLRDGVHTVELRVAGEARFDALHYWSFGAR